MLIPDLHADTWVATDALGRMLPVAPCAPRPDRYVGVFYFVWHGHHGTPGPYDLSKITQETPPKFGGVGEFHWWGEPEVGYFRSIDPWLQRRNLEMLGNAGVDVLFVDVTNAFTYREEMAVLFETAERMRAQGSPTPRVAFVLNAHPVATVKRLWEEWYRPRKHAGLWFPWLGKPLILADPDAKDEDGQTVPPEIRSFFTWRRSWFETDPNGWFGDGRDRWPWRDRTPQKYGWHDDPKVAEQIAVGVASHPTNGIGRSTRNGKIPPLDALGSAATYDQGIQFEEQWRRVFETDPKMVFVTGWNEWVAQRFLVAKGQQIDLAGQPLKEGDTFFVDLYNREFSRDLDPMRGGYTDNYYYQLIANVRRFKGARPIPRATAPATIRVEGPFAQWRGIGPEFRDNVGDTMPRDADGWGSLHYRNVTGRNDIVAAKVARDAQNLAFYVRTAAPLTPSADPRWMVLYLDVDQSAATGRYGYDYRVASGWLERWSGRWTRLKRVPTRTEGKELHLAIPRKLVGYRGGLDFKWTDNSTEDGLFLDGDAAPPRRFRYRYRE